MQLLRGGVRSRHGRVGGAIEDLPGLRGLLGIAGCTALTLAASGKFFIAYIGGLWLVARGMTRRSNAKAQLDKILEAKAEPPRAQIVQ